MLTGVEILLERMKTNPEEFVEGGYSKWSRVLDTGWAVMTEDEREALQAGMNEAKRDHFNGEVMKVLAQGHDDHLLTMGMGSFSAPSAIITPQSMIEQVKDTLDKQFDEAYARKDKKTMQTASKLKGMMRK
jgi:hypothetical protein